MLRLLALFLLVTVLPSCSSILGHATQEIAVLTPGARDSVCYIDNGEIMYRTWPPQKITISKRAYDLKIRCVADGNREQSIIVPAEPEATSLGNLATGFLPGMLVDYETGALFAFPETVVVDFSAMAPRPMPRPNYDLHLAENPDLFGMEEFRPGDMALMRDKYDQGYTLKKKEHPGRIFTSGLGGDEGNAAAAADGTAESSSAPATADDLTRGMNPAVFSGGGGDSSGSGALPPDNFMPAPAPPVTIYPLDGY